MQVNGNLAADKQITQWNTPSPFFDTRTAPQTRGLHVNYYQLVCRLDGGLTVNKGCDGTLTALSQLRKENRQVEMKGGFHIQYLLSTEQGPLTKPPSLTPTTLPAEDKSINDNSFHLMTMLSQHQQPQSKGPRFARYFVLVSSSYISLSSFFSGGVFWGGYLYLY